MHHSVYGFEHDLLPRGIKTKPVYVQIKGKYVLTWQQNCYSEWSLDQLATYVGAAIKYLVLYTSVYTKSLWATWIPATKSKIIYKYFAILAILG